MSRSSRKKNRKHKEKKSKILFKNNTPNWRTGISKIKGYDEYSAKMMKIDPNTGIYSSVKFLNTEEINVGS